ncbi:hypothetical protein [Kibdelosporangium aridum]|uniref:hypothetical protein n=1 Tax=Kibdelosporangium aridum TaxID=2030 RepID=UPI0035E7AE79
MIRFIHRLRTRRAVALSASGAILIGLCTAGLLLTPPPVQPRLLAGSVWLTSRAIGEVTLVSGTAAEVSAGIGVTGPNGHFDTQQQGHTAYAIDKDAKLVVGVSGATLRKASAQLSSGVSSVFATANAVFAVNRSQRTVQASRGDTLAPIGNPMELAGKDHQFVSDGRALWAASSHDGTLVSYTADNGVPVRKTHQGVLTPGAASARLVVANGQPVVIDQSTHTASPAGTGRQRHPHHADRPARRRHRERLGHQLDRSGGPTRSRTVPDV